MAEEILAVPEERLAEVIRVLRAGIKTADVSDEVREQLREWCDSEEEYLRGDDEFPSPVVLHKDEDGRWHAGTDAGHGPDCSQCPSGDGTYSSLEDCLVALLNQVRKGR